MKIIGIAPTNGYPEYILQATETELARVLGRYWAGEDNVRGRLVPGAEIAVDAMYESNRKTGEAVDALKKLPTTLRAFADILSGELEVLSAPAVADGSQPAPETAK